jgi:putative ABC transport system substrate-binding protein
MPDDAPFADPCDDLDLSPHMNRRGFLAVMGGAAVGWPLCARAQRRSMPVIGLLSSASRDRDGGRLLAFKEGLKDAGYVEGRNLAIDYRWADEHNERLPALAADLVSRQVEVIAAAGSSASALAAKAATSTVPIVFTTGFDPVDLGLVSNLARPGGNITGVTSMGGELDPKRLELLYEVVPTARTICALANPMTSASRISSRRLQEAARDLGVDLHVLNASAEEHFTQAFTTLAQLKAGALVIETDAFFISRGETLGALAAQQRVPAVFQFRAFAAAGGLMSYGGNLADLYRRAGAYVGRILNGEKAADLPVQQSTKVDLVINLRSARALGLTVPQSLLLRADELIQ